MNTAEQATYTPAWVRGSLIPGMFGITQEAARKYRERGVWLEGKHWKKDPLGKVVYNPQAISNWLGS